MEATIIERGNLELVYEPGQSYVVLRRDPGADIDPDAIGLSFDDIAWLIHTAGPAALAAGQTITPTNQETPLA